MQGHEDIEFSGKIDFGIWKRIFQISKPFTKHLILIMICMAICAVADVIFPKLTGYAIDHLIANQTADGVEKLAVIFLITLLVECTCTFGFLYLANTTEVGICYLIRKQGFQKLQELPFSYYDRMPVGFLLSRLTKDTDRVGGVVAWSLLDFVWGMVYMVICAVQMFTMNTKMAAAVMLIVLPISVLTVYFERKIRKAHRKVRKTNSEITGAYNEGVMGAKTTKTLAREEGAISEFNTLTRRMHSQSMKSAILEAIYMPVVGALGMTAVSYVLYTGGMQVMAIPAGLTLGAFTVFLNYALNFFNPVTGIAQTLVSFQSAQAAAERVLTLLATEPDIKDTPEVIEAFGDNFHPKKENWPKLVGDIVFEDVTFRYDNGKEVLSHFNLHVKAGESIALVGETGAGKSTIINLICRFYEPSEGRILIDGVDYKQRSLLWLENNIGYVLQQPHMFSGNIMDNIRYGRPEATEDEVIAAAKLANAHDFITRLPKGYETEVGEGGDLLSSGEKQLVSFARAILVDPALFILDEATSSVDTQSEALIQKAISGILAGRTSFMVAHRLSTVREADRILVINDGKIIEEGNHEQLLQKHGYYFDLYTHQFEDEESQKRLNQIGS